MRRRLPALLLTLALTLSLSGCWDEEPEPDAFWDETPAQSDETPAQTPAQISVFTLPYLSGQSFDPITCIDGIQQTVGALLYEGLFTLDAQFEPQPLLCARFDYDTDALTYTFTLRSGVLFSDGTALTANDVLATYRRAAESERYGARFANVASMKAVSPDTLSITLARADLRFPALLDIPIVRAGTESRLVPLGTGPYVYTSDSNDGASLTAQPNWHGGSPPLARIALAAAKDNDTALSLFSSRSVHFFRLDPTGTGARMVGGTVELLDVPTAAMQFLGFNTRRALLANDAVRRAMSGLLDRAAMVSSLLSGHGAAAQFPVSPESALYPRSMEHRTTAAEYVAALESAGVSAARPQTLTLLVNEENSFRRAIAESICAQLSTDALTLTVRALPWEEYLAALADGSFDLYLGETRLAADWDVRAFLDPLGTLNYGAFESEPLLAQHDAFLAGGSKEVYFTAFSAQTPFAPLLFKSDAILTPAGLIDGMTPTPSNPFSALEHWTFHLSGESE